MLAWIDRVDLVKMDVEGHEGVIFRSAEPHLERLRPRAILFEDRTRQAGPDGTIGSLLGRLGYDVFGIDKTLFSTRLAPLANPEDCRFNDYLALRRPGS